MKRYPLSFLILSGLGVACGIPAIASLAGMGDHLHPLLADRGAGIALLVTAIALIGSGLFPLVLARLTANDQPAAPPGT